MITVHPFTSGAEALRVASAFLAVDPIGNNMVAAALHPDAPADGFVVTDDEAVLGVGVRFGAQVTLSTLDRSVLQRSVPQRSVLAPLAAHLAGTGVTRLLGDAGPTARVAGAWSECTGGSFVPVELYRMYELVDVPDPPTGGHLRPVGFDDLERQVAWSTHFATETDTPHDLDGLRDFMERALAQHLMLGWYVDDVLTSRLFLRPPAFGVVRIGGVYTPPELRGQGHGASVTAAASRQALAQSDVDTVILNTQAGNAGSNRLYRSLGYVSHSEWLIVDLLGSDPSTTERTP